ncbi:phosphomannomutase [Candidatus Magnetoovum chiemensis]|nr:phosphomannomutase [Candidatus Magnetoovum chiemensis]
MKDLRILSLAKQWAHDNTFDLNTRLEIQNLLDNNRCDELTDRFYKTLEFGTGGLRGIMQAGTNRINKYTLQAAVQGLCHFISRFLDTHSERQERGVCIAYDSRNNSQSLAFAAAEVLAANNIKAYIFNTLRPVPELSFCIRYKKAIAGICITASHNPPKYNGLKVYFKDGAQITHPIVAQISAEINKINGLSAVSSMTKETAIEKGLIEIIGEQEDNAYLKEILKQSIRQPSDNITIVYSPIHGAGYEIIPKVLNLRGFSKVITVKEQMTPDGNFPTVKVPNPEEKESLTMALNYAKTNNSDIFIATDADSDRIGLGVKSKNNDYVLLNGNQIGALLCDYILNGLKDTGKLPKQNGAVVTTIVTTPLINEIARAFGIECITLLTGFKYIGRWINDNPQREFIFGCEESYGYLRGTYTRDKDAVLAASLICEMASYYNTANSSILERLNQIYSTHGYYEEELYTFEMEGQNGALRIKTVMDKLRTNAHKNPVPKLNLTHVNDYAQSIGGLPTSDVLEFNFDDNTRISIRPSGTEPKLKIYICVKGSDYNDCRLKIENVQTSFIESINAL